MNFGMANKNNENRAVGLGQYGQSKGHAKYPYYPDPGHAKRPYYPGVHIKGVKRPILSVTTLLRYNSKNVPAMADRKSC